MTSDLYYIFQAGKSPNDVKRLFELEKLDVRECIGVSIRKKIKEGEVESKASPKMFCYVQIGSVDDHLQRPSPGQG